jgi:hypothetical protein
LPKYKFKEDEILELVKNYIDSTYNQHYSGKDNIQTVEYLYSTFGNTDFLNSNIIKYASRMNKKGEPKKDVMKIFHYALLVYYYEFLHNKEQKD